MKVLVSDSSIQIEFSRRDLLDKMFKLDLQFAVPDLLFHKELKNHGSCSRKDLLALALGWNHWISKSWNWQSPTSPTNHPSVWWIHLGARRAPELRENYKKDGCTYYRVKRN